MVVKNVTRGAVLAERADEAKTLWQQIGGLIIRPPLKTGEALLIPSIAPWVHSFFMKYPIDVAILDGAGRVLAAKTLVPWRMTRPYPTGCMVVELVEGTIARTHTQYGDKIEIA